MTITPFLNTLQQENMEPRTAGPDIQLLSFLRLFANTSLRHAIIMSLVSDPDRPRTAREVAGQVGQRLRAVQAELDDLVLLGLLTTRQQEDTQYYQLTTDPQLRRLAGRFRERFLADECRDPS